MLQQSDQLVSELKHAKTLIVATPMYNFGVPASLKAWIDLVCRVGETFHYTENGPVGLSGVQTLYIVAATGGVPVDSPADFLVPYLRQFARFIGVQTVQVIAADRVNAQRDAALAAARDQIASI